MFTPTCDPQKRNECIAQRTVCICDVVLKHPLFKNLVREQTHEFSNIADIIDLDEKQVLFFKLQEMDRVYFVLRGAVKLFNLDDNSSKEYIYQITEQGDSIGLENLFTDLNYYPYGAIALAPSKILSLKAKEFKAAIAADPVIKTNFLEYLSRLTLDLYDRSKDFVLSSVAERLLKYLTHQAILNNRNDIHLLLSKTDLANYLGTISSTLSRAFKELEEKSLIEVHGNDISLFSRGVS